MGKWIFQDIKDTKDSVLYENMRQGKTMKESISLYNAALRERVIPETYVRYMMWQCDIYIDSAMIIVSAQNVYPELSEKQITEWIMKHKEAHHFVV